MDELRKYFNISLARGFIQPTKSWVAAPVLFKEKKDGSMKLWIDFKVINTVCVENTYPLPLMKYMLTHLAKGKVFTKLKIREAYYQCNSKREMNGRQPSAAHYAVSSSK